MGEGGEAIRIRGGGQMGPAWLTVTTPRDMAERSSKGVLDILQHFCQSKRETQKM